MKDITILVSPEKFAEMSEKLCAARIWKRSYARPFAS